MNEVSKNLKLSRSTTYYWFRKFSTKKQTHLRVNKQTNQEQIGEFIGVFAGDGNYYLDKNYRHVIRISLDSRYKPYVSYVSDLFKSLFDKNPWIYIYSPSNVTIIRVISKPVIEFISEYLHWNGHKTATVKLKNRAKYSVNFFIGFLRGLIDTDGYISRNRAVFSTISEGLSKDITYSLRRLDIGYKMYKQIDKRPNMKPVYRVAITNDLDYFVRLINPNRFKYTRE